MPREITSYSNDTVKRLRSLRDKKARREDGLFLAEGLRILADARDMGRLPEVIAGVNLPMLIRLEGARKAMTVRAAVAAAREAGRKYISVASEILGEAAA